MHFFLQNVLPPLATILEPAYFWMMNDILLKAHVSQNHTTKRVRTGSFVRWNVVLCAQLRRCQTPTAKHGAAKPSHKLTFRSTLIKVWWPNWKWQLQLCREIRWDTFLFVKLFPTASIPRAFTTEWTVKPLDQKPVANCENVFASCQKGSVRDSKNEWIHKRQR